MAEAVVSSAETKLQVEVPVRQTIHVNREIGLVAVFVFAISSIGLVYSGMLPFSILAGMWPGTNLAGMIAVGGLVTLIITYTFAAIGTLAPRFGADYIIASRVVSPPLAFASSWTLMVFLGLAGGALIAMIAQNIIPMFARSLSIIVRDDNLLNMLGWITSPSGTITLGTVGVVLLFLALIAPPFVTHRILLFGAIVSVALWVWICLILATASPAMFQNAWDQYTGAGLFNSQVATAENLGMKLDFSTRTMLVAGFMLSLWVFSGVFNPVYFSREIKEPKKSLLAGSMLGLVAATALMVTAAALLQRLVPAGWLSAQSFLSHASAYQETAMPWLTFYVVILRPNDVLTRILGLFSIFSMLMMAHTFLYTGSRILLAWCEDQLMPQQVAFIHPQLRSPLIAVLLICLLADFGVVEAALNTDINNRINAVFFFIGVQLLPVLGVTLLPFIRGEWFRKSSGFVRARIGPLPLITLIGGVCLVYLVGMLAALIIWPGYNPLNTDTLVWFAAIFFSGLAWFYARRFTLARQGRDINPLLHSVPEEE